MDIPKDINDLTNEQIENLKIRKSKPDVGSYFFRVEEKPGVIKYYNIKVNKKYRIENPDHRGVNGQIVTVTSFLYKWKDDEKSTQPLGVGIRFAKNNKKSTYYKVQHLKEI